MTLITFPGRVATHAAGDESPAPAWLVRTLGVRLVGQGCWLALDPSDRALGCATVIEAVHGSTMIAALVSSGSYRRSAAIAATLAGISVALGLALRA